MLNVFSEQFAGNPYVAVVTQVQQLMMLLTGALDAVSQIQLKSGVALATVVYVPDDRHEPGLMGT